MTARTVAEASYELLKARGVTRIFGNPGSNELTMLTSLPDGIEYVLALQEGAAIAIADGFAQASGELGVVNLHSSSGTGNAMGNLTNSAAAHAPLLVIAGQQSRRYVPLNAMLTNNDATRLTEPLVKFSAEPLRPDDVPLALSQAALSAQSAPTGPTFVSVPLDDWNRPMDAAAAEPLLSRRVAGIPVVRDAELEEIIAALDAAVSPVLVLGPGAGGRRRTTLAAETGVATALPTTRPMMMPHVSRDPKAAFKEAPVILPPAFASANTGRMSQVT